MESSQTEISMEDDPTDHDISVGARDEVFEDSLFGASPPPGVSGMEGVVYQSDVESVVDGSVLGEMPF